MSRIPQDVIDAINQNVQISRLVARYTKVEGDMALCPFHDDKTASLSLSDEKGLYHCHACGASGNAIQFFMFKEGLEFREAAERLAKEAGVAIPRDASTGSATGASHRDPYGEKNYYLRKLQENLKTFQQCEHSVCISTYQEDKPDPSSKEQPWRNNFYPRLNEKGTPAFGLSAKQLSYFRKRSLENRKMISVAVSLFGPKQAVPKKDYKPKYPNKSRSDDNATHLLYVGLDFDNVEWKAHKHDKEYNIPDKREAFLNETKARLWEKMKARLEALKLWEYAAVTDTGSGYHCLFVLDRIAAYADVDRMNEPGVYSPGEAFEWTMKNLATLAGSDPAPVKRTSLFKPIPGTYYWKEPKPREVVVKKDARGFLTFEALSALLPRDPLADVEKRYQIYAHAFKHFGGMGRDPDEKFLTALNGFYQSKPSGDDVAVDFKEYVDFGNLPGTKPEDDRFYGGREDWENRDGSAIKITKSYAMKYRVKKLRKDAEGNEEYADEWYSIPCGWALVPKYRIEEPDDPEAFKIVFDCLRPDERRTVTVEGRRFGSTDSLQKALRAQQVDITLNNKSTAALFSYAVTWAKRIENVNVGVNWFDEKGELAPALVGWDFVRKNGKTILGDGEALEGPDGQVWRRRGWEMRTSNRKRKKHAKADVSTAERPLNELTGRIDKIFVKPEVSRFFLSFLGMAAAREQILDRFSGVPFLSLHGETGCGKSTLLEIASEIFNQQLLTAKPTVSTTYLTQKYRRNGLLLFDELDEHHVQFLMPMLKDSVSNSAYRPRQDREGRVVGDNQILNTPIVATNLPLHYHGEAWDNRMAKIAFNKKMRKVDVDALAELRHYSERHGFEVYVDLFERVAAIDFDALYEDVLWLEKLIAQVIKKDIRLAQYYAVVLAVGRKLDIGIDLEAMMDFVAANEADRGTTSDLLVSNILECVEELTAENSKPGGWLKEFDAKHTGGAIFPQVFPLKLSRFTEFLARKNVFRNVDQRAVEGLVYSLSFVKKVRTSATAVIHNEIVTENGIFLFVDFGAEEFVEQLHTGISCVVEDRRKREVTVYARVKE